MNPISTYVLPVALFTIMIGIGMGTRVSDFEAILKNPRVAIIGVISQTFLLPILGMLYGWGLGLSEALILGFIIIGLCPSGSASNIVTQLANGNLALSVSLTTVSSITALFMLPLGVSWYLELFSGETTQIKMPIGSTILNIFTTIILPVIIGLFISEKMPSFNAKAKKVTKYLLPGILFITFALMLFIDESQEDKSELWRLMPHALAFNLISVVAAFYFPRLLRTRRRDAVTIAIEGGLRNAVVGIYVATTILKNDEIGYLIMSYGVVSFVWSLLLAMGLRKFA